MNRRKALKLIATAPLAALLGVPAKAELYLLDKGSHSIVFDARYRGLQRIPKALIVQHFDPRSAVEQYCDPKLFQKYTIGPVTLLP